MQIKRPKRAPAALAFAVLTLVCGLRLFNPDFLERLERMTYDVRVRAAQHFPAPAATNLAFVSMEDSSIAAVRTNAFGYRFGLYWPRQVYGRVVEELSAQGANAVAFDVLFGELRPDHPPVQLADGGIIESDDFFAQQMRHAGNVLIARTPDVTPPNLFVTNASRSATSPPKRTPMESSAASRRSVIFASGIRLSGNLRTDPIRTGRKSASIFPTRVLPPAK